MWQLPQRIFRGWAIISLRFEPKEPWEANRGDDTMTKLLQTHLWTLAAVGVLAANVLSVPARAGEFLTNVGPVGPHEAILTTVGSKRLIAFYEPDGANCGLSVVMWDSADESDESPARVRVSLIANQTVHIDSAENNSINLQCGDHAKTLSLVDTNNFVAAGAAQ
jgi:hypothetical protein